MAGSVVAGSEVAGTVLFPIHSQVLQVRHGQGHGSQVRLCPGQDGGLQGRRHGHGLFIGTILLLLLLLLLQVLPNIPEFPLAFLGAAGAGLAVTTFNPTYRSHGGETTGIIVHFVHLELLHLLNLHLDRLSSLQTRGNRQAAGSQRSQVTPAPSCLCSLLPCS